MYTLKFKPLFCAIEDISTFEHRGCFQHSLFKYSSVFLSISSFLKFSNLEDEFILFVMMLSSGSQNMAIIIFQ
jgi:hypothetical protein